jgi:hypothetical protein
MPIPANEIEAVSAAIAFIVVAVGAIAWAIGRVAKRSEVKLGRGARPAPSTTPRSRHRA